VFDMAIFIWMGGNLGRWPNVAAGSSYQLHVDEAVQDNNQHGNCGMEKESAIRGDDEVVGCLQGHGEEVHMPSKKEGVTIFCKFLITTLFPALASHPHVYDIAGGRGELAMLLALRDTK
jgi:hypothetical protein